MGRKKKLRQRNGIKTAVKIAAPWCCTCVCRCVRRVCVSTVAISSGGYGGGDGSRLLFLLPAFRLFSLFTTGWRVDHFCCWFPFFPRGFRAARFGVVRFSTLPHCAFPGLRGGERTLLKMSIPRVDFLQYPPFVTDTLITLLFTRKRAFKSCCIRKN